MLLDGRNGKRTRGPRGLLGPMLLVVGLVALGGLAAGLLPSLNPFKRETVDRSQPAVLRSIEKLSEYRAATANLQVIVDVEQDYGLLPSWLKGERALLVAAGRVDAAVDFRGLDRDAVKVGGDRRSVTLTLPAPALSEAQLDLDRTRVYDRDRGIFDRIESVFEDSPTGDRELLRLAEDKLRTAAQEDRGVLQAAETNTRAMLTGLLQGLGFRRVDVRFTPPPAT